MRQLPTRLMSINSSIQLPGLLRARKDLYVDRIRIPICSPINNDHAQVAAISSAYTDGDLIGVNG